MKIYGEEFLSMLDKDRELSKYLWKIILLEAAVIVSLAVSFLFLKETVKVKVELPAKFMYEQAPVVLAGIDGANETYYKLWAEYLTAEIASFTPDNATEKIDILRKTMLPTTLASKKSELDTVEKTLIVNLITQKYKVLGSKNLESSKTDKDSTFNEMTIKVNGIAQQNVGNNKTTTDKECSYEFTFKNNGGLINVEDFGTDCY